MTSTISATATISTTSTLTPTGTITQTQTITPTPEPPRAIVVYPNPFCPASAVDHLLKIDNLPANSSIAIYTVSGELIRKYEGVSGRQTWDGKNRQHEDVVPGIYIYVIKQDSQEKTKGVLFITK
jgi:hypothetical protein